MKISLAVVVLLIFAFIILSEALKTRVFNARIRIFFSRSIRMDSDPSEPLSSSARFKSETRGVLAGVVATGSLLMRGERANAAASEEGVYIDTINRFRIDTPPSFTVQARKVPTPTMLEYVTEESFMIATSFAEGSSLSVTRSNAALLLKDFNVDWWFSPLNSLKDVGNPPLIAQLLILQRQGEFKKKETASQVKESRFSDDGNTLLFEFVTPLAPQVQRKTINKTVLRDGKLYSAWISALTSVFDAEGGYGPTLYKLRDSFELT
jgi:hypothetical protein